MTCHACHLCGALTRPGEWFCPACYEEWTRDPIVEDDANKWTVEGEATDETE